MLLNPSLLRRALWIALITLSAFFLVPTKYRLSEGPFIVAPAQFEAPGATISAATQFGPFRLVKGRHYLIEVDRMVGGRFEVRLAYSNGQRSRPLLLDRRWGNSGALFRASLPAEMTDPAAVLRLDPISPGVGRFDHLRVVGLQTRFFTLRTLLNFGRYPAIAIVLIALIQGLVLAARQLSRVPSRIAAAMSGDPALRTVRLWALGLVLVSVGFGGTMVVKRYHQLYLQPYYPAVCGLDDSYYFFWLRSVMVDGDVDFANDLLYCDTMPLEMRRDIVQTSERTKLGLLPNKYPIGWALMEAPWYCAADLTAQAADCFGADIPYDGWHVLYQTWLVLGQLVYACLGLYLAYRIVAYYLPGPIALCGVSLTWLASSVFYYQMDQVSMAHNVMFFAGASAFFWTQRLRDQPDRYLYWALTGMSCALVILARYQGGVLLLFPGWLCLQLFLKRPARIGQLMLAMAIGAGLLSLQLLAWRAVFGSWLVYSYAGERFYWLKPQLFNVLFSPLHGLFNWHPVMLVGFVGFAIWAVRSRWHTDAACFAGSLLLVTYVNAAWYCWWFGGSFGLRSFEVCTIFAMIGVSYLLGQLWRVRRAAFYGMATCLLLLGIWNVNLAWMVEQGRLPGEAALTWRQRFDMVEKYWGES